MSQEHYNYIKEKVIGIANLIPKYKEHLKTDTRVKDLNKRLLWDVFYSTKIYNNYSYQEFDYKDTRIETAMKAIFKELNL